MGSDPASQGPAGRAALEKADFLVVQDLFLTELAKLADVVLPAVSWAETDGTFTNLERRVQRAPKALANPHSQAVPDWLILVFGQAVAGLSAPQMSAEGKERRARRRPTAQAVELRHSARRCWTR